jgi:branched-chain amino acid transport system substrate-binding protein
MNKKLSILLALLFTATVLLSGCSKKTSTEGNTAGDTIKIGVFEPITGANAA